MADNGDHGWHTRKVLESIEAVWDAVDEYNMERMYVAEVENRWPSKDEDVLTAKIHVHVHVIPRYEDDDISFAPPRHRLTEKEGKRVAERIGEHTAVVVVLHDYGHPADVDLSGRWTTPAPRWSALRGRNIITTGRVFGGCRPTNESGASCSRPPRRAPGPIGPDLA